MEDLWRREQGQLVLDARGLTHRPHKFLAAATGHLGLVSRLHLVEELPASGALYSTSWSSDASRLISAGEDCRLRIWRGDGSQLLHTVDTGHTSSILAAQFLPNRPDHVITGSADKQIRHVNVSRGGARPYVLHKGRVRSLVPLDSHLVLSGSEDGTVREVDVRVKPPPLNRTQELQPASEDYNVLVDQRAERIGRSRAKVGINSIAVDALRPWLILTGGTDPLLRLYDRRMLPLPTDGHGSRSKAPQWVSCYIPAHLKADLWDSRPTASPALGAAAGAGYQLTAVAFARGGAEVVGSYTGHGIYSFDSVEHARDVESLLHIPETVLRVPTRPRTQARRSAHQWVPLQEPHGRSPTPQLLQAAPRQGISQAGSMQQQPAQQQQQQQQQTAGAGGPPSGPRAGQHSQGTGRAGPHTARRQGGRQRSLGIGASLRHLEHLRRGHSQIRGGGGVAGGGGGGGEHAESSRPTNWQHQRPSSSTLRSPLHGPRYLSAAVGPAGAAGPAGPSPGGTAAAGYLTESGSEVSEEVGAAAGAAAGAGDRRGAAAAGGGAAVRRSRRLRQRRRVAEEEGYGLGPLAVQEDRAGEQQAVLVEDAMEGVVVAEVGPLPMPLPQPAVSGNAELSGASESDVGEEAPAAAAATMHSPSRRRASRRLAAAAAAAAAAAEEVQQQHSAGAPHGAAAAAAIGEAPGLHGPVGGAGAAGPSSPGGGFKQPAGRPPPRQSRYAQRGRAADAGWVDSTLGVLHHPATQPDSSEVAAVSQRGLEATLQQRGHQPQQEQQQEQQAERAGGHPQHPQQAQHVAAEVTVDMRQPTHLGSGGGGGRGASPLAVEVTSRPVLSASAVGAAATLRTDGYEASSLNSAGAAGLERVDSVVQRPLREAPSVGNAPRTATTIGTAPQHRDGPEASTGHVGPPRHAQQLAQRAQQPAQQQQQQQLQRQWQAAPGAANRHPLPTASTGTSRPPSVAVAAAGGGAWGAGAAHEGSTPTALGSGRGALRPRRQIGSLELGSVLGEASHAGAAAGGSVRAAHIPEVASAAAAPAAVGRAGEAHQQGGAPHTHNLRRQAQQQQQQQQAQQQAGGAGDGRQGPAPQQQQQQQAASLVHPQATMLSGRGPSAVGNFLPSSQQGQQLSGLEEVGAESIGQEAAQQAQQAQQQEVAQGVDQQQVQRAQRAQQQGPPDSNIGAILHMGDTGGEEVTEPTMFRCCYWGNLNLMDSLDGNGVAASPNVCFLGANSEFLAAPSDDGGVFLWDYASGSLVGVLEGGGEEGASCCVAAHPSAPVLASCGRNSVVQLWSPEAEERLNLSRALELVERNARMLLLADLQPPVQPPPGVALVGTGGGGQIYRGPDGRQMRCNMM